MRSTLHQQAVFEGSCVLESELILSIDSDGWFRLTFSTGFFFYPLIT